MEEYRGYTVTQDRESHHVIVSKDGDMVMHVPCTEQKSDAELEEMVDFYETVVGKMHRGELRPIRNEDEIKCRMGVF